jgi:hypothetical protein
MNKLLLGIIYAIIAQVITFLQLQGNIKYNWLQRFPILTLGMAIPISWLFIKSVESFVYAFNGQLWPSRLMGFAIGTLVFASMSYFLFKEPIVAKTFICLVLAGVILVIQIFWK